MLHFVIPQSSGLTCGGSARGCHCLSRPIYDFRVGCEKIAVPQRQDARTGGPKQRIHYILYILPYFIAKARECSGLSYLLDIRIMRSFVDALKRRQSRYVPETDQ